MGQASCHCEHPARDDCAVFVPHFDRKLREVCWAGPNPHEELAVYPTAGVQSGGGSSHFPMILARRAIFERGQNKSPSRSGSSGFGRRDSVAELQYRFFDAHYEIHRSLARGSFAEVFEVTPRTSSTTCSLSTASGGSCRDHPKTSRVLAAKKFARSSGDATMEAAPSTGRVRADLRQECLIFNSLEHPHLLKMFESFKGEDCDWTLIELCSGGDLFGRILALSKERGSEGGAYEEKTGQMLTRQMLSALCFLHDYFIVHCDVKPENFLVVGEPGSRHELYLKLCDFGSAVCLSDDRPRAMTTTCTLSYTPPEVYARRGCNLLGDAWSLGVVIYAILVGLNPFRSQEDTKERVLRRIMTGSVNKVRPAWKRLSEPAQTLITSLLVVDEGARASCQEINSDPWIVDAPSKERLGSRFHCPMAMEKESLQTYAGYGASLINAILWFAQLDPLQRFVFWLCGQQLPDKVIVEAADPIPWYRLFFALDQRQDGLDSHDLAVAVGSWGLDSSQVQTSLTFAFDLLDLDGSGIIEWGEWIALALSATPDLLGDWEVVDVVFQLLDLPSGDGLVGEEDLRRFFQGYSREQIEELLRPWASGYIPSVPRLSAAKFKEVTNDFGQEEEIVDAVEAEGSHEITRFERKHGGLALRAADLNKLLRAALETCRAGGDSGPSPAPTAAAPTTATATGTAAAAWQQRQQQPQQQQQQQKQDTEQEKQQQEQPQQQEQQQEQQEQQAIRNSRQLERKISLDEEETGQECSRSRERRSNSNNGSSNNNINNKQSRNNSRINDDTYLPHTLREERPGGRGDTEANKLLIPASINSHHWDQWTMDVTPL